MIPCDTEPTARTGGVPVSSIDRETPAYLARILSDRKCLPAVRAIREVR